MDTEQKVSRIVITFDAMGSAELDLAPENVTPMQLMAAATFMDWYAKNLLNQQAMAKAIRDAQAPKLAVPGRN